MRIDRDNRKLTQIRIMHASGDIDVFKSGPDTEIRTYSKDGQIVVHIEGPTGTVREERFGGNYSYQTTYEGPKSDEEDRPRVEREDDGRVWR